MNSSDTSYVYHGPTSGISLPQPGGGVREVILLDGEPPLVDGAPARLPADAPAVAGLVARGFLRERPEAADQERPGKRPRQRQGAEEEVA